MAIKILASSILAWSLVFLIGAGITAFLGYVNLEYMAIAIAKMLVSLFLVLLTILMMATYIASLANSKKDLAKIQVHGISDKQA